MVETTDGPIPIELVNPSHHTLLTWNHHRTRPQPQPNGFPVETAARHYDGPLLTFYTPSRESRSTTDHMWIAKINDLHTPAVWLTKHKQKWTAHTGPRRFFGYNNPFPRHATWLLSSASSEEQAQEQADAINLALEAGEQPEDILSRYGRDISFPFLTPHNMHSWLTGEPGSTRASNLTPQIMSLPIYHPDAPITWEPITSIHVQPYSGQVYSFRIEPHKTYVADGILTHNCLYEWRGSDPTALMSHDSHDAYRRVLRQSHRIPQKIHAKALKWIDSCPNRDRVEYLPTPSPGEVRYLDATWNMPDEVLQDAQQYLQDGKSVMLIASCSYMLDPLLSQMRASALPFHNPLRARNGQWNPLARRTSGTSTAQRLLDFLHLSQHGYWTADQLKNWAGAVRLKDTFSGGRGIAKRLEELTNQEDFDDDVPCLSWEQINALLPDDAIDAALSGNVNWLEQRLNKARRDAARFPMEVVRRHGAATLSQDPLLIPGTINSVKGGEADVVYLFPDLSHAATGQWHGSPQDRAAIYRLFYVGMTRAKQSLICCQPAHNSRLEPGPEFWLGD